MAETHREKIKEAELEMGETQWPMCKSTYCLNAIESGVLNLFLETLVKLKVEALVVENKEALANKLTYTITKEKNTLAYTLCEVETEVWVVTQVAMLEKVKFQTLERL